MRELYFKLDDNYIRPVVRIHDMMTNVLYTCMYDTIVPISVWCLPEELFLNTFSYRDSGYVISIRGADGIGKLYKVYLISLKISGILFRNVPVVLYEDATTDCSFILSYTLFKDCKVTFDNGILCIGNIVSDVRSFNIKSTNNVYCDVEVQQQDSGRCPICGSDLSSMGICSNILCAYNDIFFT